MSASLMSQSEAKTAFVRRVFLRIKTLIDHDATSVTKYTAENVGRQPEPVTRHAQPAMYVVKFQAELQVLLGDRLNGNRRCDDSPLCHGVFVQQRFSVALDLLGGEVGSGHHLIVLFH